MQYISRVLGIFAFLSTLALLAPNSSSAQDTSLKVTVLEVHDGDTITRAKFEDGRIIEGVRYVGANAPELKECFGLQAKGANEQLVLQKEVWLEMNPQDGGGFQQDLYGRFLAYVWLDSEKTDLVQVQLVQSGYARLDPYDVTDDPGLFSTRYSEQIIAAQIAAARQRLGWWGECDPYRSSDLAIAAAKFWGEDETIYIVNRGTQPIDIGQGWEIRDSTESKRNRLKFNTITGQPCLVPAGGLLYVHSGVTKEQPMTHTPCNQLEIHIYWTGNPIWNNDADKVRLFNPEGTLVYEYVYPPRGL